MHGDIRKDISKEQLSYTYLSIISNKLKIGVIGGGKAAYIKVKNFLDKGCNIEVLALDFIEDFLSLKDLKIIKSAYSRDFIKDKHLIIIATNDNAINLEIKKHCEEEYKLYIYAEDYLKGIAIAPVQRESENISFAVNTKLGNPKGSLILAKRIKSVINEYDNFIKFSSHIRKNAKSIQEFKESIINFVCSEDFKYIYDKKKDRLVLEMFFNEDVINKIYNNL